MARLLYFIPINRAPQAGYRERFAYFVDASERWYGEQMERWGFGRKIPQFEKNPDGTPIIHVIDLREYVARGVCSNEAHKWTDAYFNPVLDVEPEASPVNWPGPNNLISVHRVTSAVDWEEGNGIGMWQHPPSQLHGCTWNSPRDSNTNIENLHPEAGEATWNMSGAGDGVPYRSVATGSVELNPTEAFPGRSYMWNVTSDVLLWIAEAAPNQGWLIRKEDESAAGQAPFFSHEDQIDATGRGPHLILTFPPGSGEPTYFIPANRDAMIKRDSPNRNHGAESTMSVQRNAMLDPQLTPLPNGRVPLQNVPAPSRILVGFDQQEIEYAVAAHDGAFPILAQLVLTLETISELRPFERVARVLQQVGCPVAYYSNGNDLQGQRWFVACETEILNEAGFNEGFYGGGLGSAANSPDEPGPIRDYGAGIVSAAQFSFFKRDYLARVYDYLNVPGREGIPSYDLLDDDGNVIIQRYTPFRGYSVTKSEDITFSVMSTTNVGATIHEHLHAFGSGHDFSNQFGVNLADPARRAVGNLIGSLYGAWRGFEFPTMFPNNEARLNYASALEMNINRAFNPQLYGQITDQASPSVRVISKQIGDDGIISFSFIAEDHGGMGLSHVRLDDGINGMVSAVLPLSPADDGTTLTISTWSHSYGTPPADGNYWFYLNVYDRAGNVTTARRDEGGELLVLNTLGRNRPPAPGFQIDPPTLEVLEPFTLDAVASRDPDASPGNPRPLLFSWDLNGDGIFERGTGIDSQLKLRREDLIAMHWDRPLTQIIYLKVTEHPSVPTGHEATSISLPLALRISEEKNAAGMWECYE